MPAASPLVLTCRACSHVTQAKHLHGYQALSARRIDILITCKELRMLLLQCHGSRHADKSDQPLLEDTGRRWYYIAGLPAFFELCL